jgi:hypothetical protein
MQPEIVRHVKGRGCACSACGALSVRTAWPAALPLQLLKQYVEDKGSGEGEASDDYCYVGSHRGDEVTL